MNQHEPNTNASGAADQTAVENQGELSKTATTAGDQSKAVNAPSKSAEPTHQIEQPKLTEKRQQTPVTPHAESSEEIAPVPWSTETGASPAVVAGTDLTNMAGQLLQNGDALAKAGAKFSWVGEVPKPTQANSTAGTSDVLTGTVRVTYANGTTKDVQVSFYSEPQAQLNANYYYVNNVGDQVDPLTTPDANGRVILDAANSDDATKSLLQLTAGVTGDATGLHLKLVQPLDTSSIGIKWAEVQVTDDSMFTDANNNPIHKVIGSPYVVKVPYVVKTLKPREDSPVDADGEMTINAQLSQALPDSNGNINLGTSNGFIPTANPTVWGEYLYQNYDLACALGIITQVTGWTQPTGIVNIHNLPESSFSINLTGLKNAPVQQVKVNYVTQVKVDPMYYYSKGDWTKFPNRNKNKTELENLIKDGAMKDSVHLVLSDGTEIAPTGFTSGNVTAPNIQSGKASMTFNVVYNGNAPLIFNTAGNYENINGASLSNQIPVTKDFVDNIAKQMKAVNNSNTMLLSSLAIGTMQSIWVGAKATDVTPLQPSVPTSAHPEVDVTDGPKSSTNDDILAALVKNATEKQQDYTKDPYELPDGNKWQQGTKFEWVNENGTVTPLTFKTAGETKVGKIRITLPSGSSSDVSIKVVSRANVKAKSETVNYGTSLTADELVTNKSAFPDGTTFQFANGTEPDWKKAGSYDTVQITATYPLKNANGQKEKDITTGPTTVAVAINDSRIVNVMEGTHIPSVKDILNLPATWANHDADWTPGKKIELGKNTEGEITVHYPSSGLDQKVKVYLNVIPKVTTTDPQNFFTNGHHYDGSEGTIANGENQGGILTNDANGDPINYNGYQESGVAGRPSTITNEAMSYTPTFDLSGLQTNADGSLVSGQQSPIIKVYVPNGKDIVGLSAETDKDGKVRYYYELKPTVNVAQKVTFQFVDQYHDDAPVGKAYSQEFIPGKATNYTFDMKLPDGYEPATGTSIPTKSAQYTLAAFSKNPITVKVPIHEILHFSITFHDEESNTNLGTLDLKNPANGFYTDARSILHLPNGVNVGDYQSTSVSGVPKGVTIGASWWASFSDPNAWWWIPNYKWETNIATESKLCGANIVINLKHKTEDVTATDKKTHETRQAVVNYVKAKVNADGTYTTDGQAFDSAKLDVYYVRQATKDLVTGEVTYGPWLWDTNSGQHGYHVVSGNWTKLPQEWGAVVADVPTLDGYTAAIVTDKSGQPANQFVYPTWNGGQTDPTKASQAYTTDASVYEAQPVHTILYIPVESQPRTITAHFKIAGGDRDGQVFAPDAQVQIFYGRTGTLNVNTNKITYGDWSWDPSAGDKATPGFHIISGNSLWSLPKGNATSWGITPPDAGNDYETVSMRIGNNMTTVTFANPNYKPNTVFTNSTADEWYVRNELTTYYVPKSMVNKTITRTITLNEPGKEPQTINQTANLSRQVRINADDTGVVYSGFDGSGWSTDSWPVWSVPVHEGYQIVAQQTVAGHTTTIDLNNGQIPAEAVNSDSQDTAINITYAATATAQLAGNGSSIYNGRQITLNDLNQGIHVTVTGPTANAGTYRIQSGDVEFSKDGTHWSTTMPTDAAKYQVRLTTQGANGIKQQFGNNSIVWTQDGKSTITGTANYTITPRSTDVQLSNITAGNYTKVYDAQATNEIDASKFQIIANGVTLNQADLTGNLYEWVDAQGHPLTEKPKNVGTYYVKLTEAAFAQLQAANPNLKLTNTGLGVYTITQANATATLSGSSSKVYDGSAISIEQLNRNGEIKVSLNFPGVNGQTYTLKQNDYKISGNATDAGEYTITLTDAGVTNVENYIKSLAGTGQNGQSNVKFTNNAISGNAKFTITASKNVVSVSGTQTETYQGSPYDVVYNTAGTNSVTVSVAKATGNNDGALANLANVHLDANDFQIVGGPAEKVGSYQIVLTDTGLAKIQQALGNNYEISLDQTAHGILQIQQAQVTTTLSGKNSMVYNGAAVTTDDLYTDGSTIKVTINGAGIANLPQTFELKDGDYTWNTTDGKAPKDVGNYQITLTAAGINKIQAQINEAVGDGNVVLTSTANDAGTADFAIQKAAVSNVQLHGDEKSIYNGHPVTFDPTNAEVKNNFGFNNATGLTIPNFTSADFDWYDAAGHRIDAPTNAGHYNLKLNQRGEAALANANPNHTFVKDGKSTITGQINYIINPAELVITVTGSASKVFDNQSAQITQDQINKGDIKLVWGNSENEPVGLGHFDLTPADFEVVDEQGHSVIHANAGYNDDGTAIKGTPYKVRLTTAALAKIKMLSGAGNYTISQSQDHGDYYIYEHKAELTLTGNQTTVYGSYLPLDPNAYTLNFSNWLATDTKPTIAWQNGVLYVNGQANTKGFKWQVGDLYVDGHPDGSLPTEVGNYRVKVSKHLLDELRQLFPDYDFSGNLEHAVMLFAVTGQPSGEQVVEASHDPASYVINPADVTVKINGTEHVKYVADQTPTINYGGENGYTLSITAPTKPEGATETNEKTPIYTSVKLSAGDLEFVTTPDGVGTYQVKLSAQGLQKLQALTGATNYNWSQASAARANFRVNQMPVTITVTGESTVTYGEREWRDAITAVPTGYGITIAPESDPTNMIYYQLQAGDLQYVDTPGNVGDYRVVLSATGLANIEKTLGGNYAYPQTVQNVTSDAKLVVEKGYAHVGLNGSWETTYDGKTRLPQSLTNKYNLGDLVIYKPDGTPASFELQPGDLAFADGTNPKNVGTYDVVLSASGKQRIQDLDGNNGNNYDWDYEPTALYTIDQATGQAKLTGQNQKEFDGSQVTTAEVNKDGQITVDLTLPVYSQPSEPGQEPQLIETIELGKYTLQDGDYTWADGSAPTKAGTYTINLNTDKILSHLQARLNDLAGTGQDNQSNVTIVAKDLSGTAQFTINPKAATVALSGNDGKIYDGHPAVINPAKGSWNDQGLVAGDKLNTSGLTASDYEWVDANGAPINVGTYYIQLTPAGVKKLQAANPNYRISESGRIKYVISPAKAAVTITGFEKSTKATINPNKYQVNVPAGITVPTGLEYEFTETPNHSGTYNITLTPASLQKLKDANPNYDLEISSTAQFELDATLKIEFQDTDADNQQVGSVITKTGVAGSSIDDLGLIIPANYDLAPGQTLPKHYQFGTQLEQFLYIKLVHKIQGVNPTDPTTNPEPSNPDWFKEHHLVKDITRTINYQGLNPEQLGQIPAEQKQQTVEFVRKARYDLVTGQLIAGSEGPWMAVDGHEFAGFTPHEFAGYAAHPAMVPAMNVTSDDPDCSLTVTYTKNPVIPDQPGTHGGHDGQPGTNGNGSATGYDTADQITNDHSITNQLAQHTKNGAKRLPQTGNQDNEATATVGFIFAGLVSIIGLSGINKKKKHD
ncbi:MBG domain-containing protein [uncultured Limosilactobacillus sp.]|uniref:MBG domain-containing protein n=1 Tax=uncultured Limosilactobacillus sp. TaxID=2837629 RepID=UPI0025E4AEAB|nr:MBG domain-containing protein [uncultured Limosilactobacillus sp.]